MMTKNDVISEAGTLHFHFTGEYSKLNGVKTMGTRGKINTIWWNINLQKLADNVDMNFEQICKISRKKT